MRVIGGELRRRVLRAPAGLGTRPSSDRLREALFNILGPGVAGGVFVDAYAGSGAVGIEAWSRGARPVLFIESAPEAARALRDNLRELDIAGTVLAGEAVAELGRLERRPEVAARAGCDYFFFDPPYDDVRAYKQTLEGLERRPGLAGGRAQIIAECRRGSKLPESCGALRQVRAHRVGDSELVFYRRAAEAGC